MDASTQASAKKTPLLFGKRQVVAPEIVEPYKGTDTERDLKR